LDLEICAIVSRVKSAALLNAQREISSLSRSLSHPMELSLILLVESAAVWKTPQPIEEEEEKVQLIFAVISLVN
jgi:hypothetical protein